VAAAPLSSVVVAGGSPDFDGAADEALRRLQTELPPWLGYHDVEHTAGLVVPAARVLADDLGLDERDTGLLVTAAWYHDIGFVEQYEANEAVALAIVRSVLPEFGFGDEMVEAVAAAIWSTRIPQEPDGVLAEALCDADLWVLGTDRFAEREALLRAELEVTGLTYDDDEWNRRQLQFLEDHRYFTSSATTRNAATKEANVALVRDRLAPGAA
jgi:uncharacterized protein